MGHNYPGPPLWPPHSRTAARAMAVLVHTRDALAHILHGGRTTRLYFRGCCCGCGIQTVPYRHRRRHVYSAGVNRCGGSETTASASQTVRSAMRNGCPCTGACPTGLVHAHDALAHVLRAAVRQDHILGDDAAAVHRWRAQQERLPLELAAAVRLLLII